MIPDGAHLNYWALGGLIVCLVLLLILSEYDIYWTKDDDDEPRPD